jgi:hypothetical protein
MEVEKSTGDPADASGDWQAFQDHLASLSGDDLLAAAASRMDVDGLLTWVALWSALENGDYVDEILLTGSDARASGGEVRAYFTFTAWDNDDLYEDCHYSGRFSLDDPNEILYCVEGEVEKILLADAAGYGHFTDLLGALLERVTPDHMQELLDRTGSALLPWFERGDICTAMTELIEDNPAAADPIEAQRDIREHLDLFRDEYESRRTFLLQRLDGLRRPDRRRQPARSRTDWPDQWSRPSPSRRENSASTLDPHYN